MPSTSPRSSPARSLSVVLRAAKSKAKFGAADKGVRSCGQRSHPSGRPFQERNRTRQLAAKAAQDWCADSQHQTHVVVKGQPRHKRGTRWDFDVEVREIAAHQLLEIHLKVPVRDHHPGWQPGRTRAVLQIRDVGQISRPNAVARHRRPDSDRIDFDDLGNGVQACLINVFGDVFRSRRCSENDCGRRIGKDCAHPLIIRAAVRQRQRNRDQPSLHGSQEAPERNRGSGEPGSLPGLRPTREG